MAADVWASARAYEAYVGRWSRLVARAFLTWLAVPPRKRWLDVGCGTGALSHTIRERCAPLDIVAIDRAETFVHHTRDAAADTIGVVVSDASALPLGDRVFDVAVSGLVLNFLAQPEQALREVRRVLRPAGIAGVYVWDYEGGMQLMRYFWDAAVVLDPGAADLDEGRRFPICRAAPLQTLFEDAGFNRVDVKAIDVPTHFSSFDDYWLPFLGGQGPAPGYVLSLPERGRTRLRDLLRERLPIHRDGSIALSARAWAVRADCQAA